MPSVDTARNCHVVRVVYDGPGFAGKTTNLKRICDLVPTSHRSEMVTPAELKGRTMFFDWLEINGPRNADVDLRFQLITVPGQEQRNYRRRPLVEVADVVVFVADSSPEHLADTQRTFARLRASMKRRTTRVPLIVQANKQDVEGALEPEKLRKRLRLAADVPVLTASAVSGEGVQNTLALAMRIGTEMIEGIALEPLLEAFADPDTLFDHVLTFEDTPINDEQIDVEELHIGAEEVEISPEVAAGHLAARSFEELEARGRRAASQSGEQPQPESAMVPRDKTGRTLSG